MAVNFEISGNLEEGASSTIKKKAPTKKEHFFKDERW